MWFGMLAVFTFVGAPLLIVTMIKGGPNAPPVFFAVFWLAILAWFWFVALVFISYEIRLFPNGEVEFKSVLRSIRVNVGDVTYVGPAFGGWDMNTLVFKFSTGSARVARSMNGFHSMLNQLLARNPDIQLRGL
jgi:hypothetical protein